MVKQRKSRPSHLQISLASHLRSTNSYTAFNRERWAGKIVQKITDGMGGYAPGTLTINDSLFVPRESVTVFLDQLSQIDFWDLPTKVKSGGFDGAQWILEGIKNGKYHIVDRWSPEAGDYRDTALALVGLSNLTVDPIY